MIIAILPCNLKNNQFHSVIPGIIATAPAPIDPALIAQRTDEVSKILHILTDTQTSTLMLIGESGMGKSTVAAILYYQLELARRTSMSCTTSPYLARNWSIYYIT